MNKLNKFTEYIGIAIDGDFIALGGAALPNCSGEKQFSSYW